jgi:hypothetical protein
VLVRNVAVDGALVLPLDRSALRRVAVLGPNAEVARTLGGGGPGVEVRFLAADGTVRGREPRTGGAFTWLSELVRPQSMEVYARLCGWTLARAHARSGDRIAISAYLGSSSRFDNAIADFAETGRVRAQSGV